jgi:hypothetical protein
MAESEVKKYLKARDHVVSTEIAGASTTTINPPYIGIRIDADCVVNIKCVGDDTTITQNFLQGESLPWVVDLITSITPTGAVTGLR